MYHNFQKKKSNRSHLKIKRHAHMHISSMAHSVNHALVNKVWDWRNNFESTLTVGKFEAALYWSFSTLATILV